MEKVSWQIGLVFALSGFVLRELWGLLKQAKQNRSNHLDKSIEKNTEAIQALTLRLTEFSVEIRHMTEKIESLPKIQKDLDQAHEKIRTLETR